MNHRTFTTLAAAGALLISGSAFAHHGRGLIYDTKKETTVKGTVTEYLWRNPHVEIGLEAVDAKAVPRQWLIEASSAGVLAQKGWSKRSIKPGEVVTVTFHPGVKGAATGDLMKVVFADGRELPR
jgi:hypothetical protein